MRPYLAILKDSFREALASRVLWVFTGLIALLLVTLAPVGYSEDLTGEFSWGDILDGPQLVERLTRDFARDQPSPGRRIWSLLDEESRVKLQKFAKAERADGRDFFRGMSALRSGLNKLVSRRDLYDEASWQGVPLPKEARELLSRPREQLSAAEVARLNRLLIQTPLQAHFLWRSPQSISVRYLWLATDPLPFSKKQVDNIVKEWILTQVMGWIVGVFGMIAAIVITSNVIPQMFEPGSITLLLSKPISRSLLFATKFIGACAFVLLNVTLLVGGLWAIAGLRLGIWNEGMLWCIPVFLFMFLIYYAVSAVSGVIWKNAIVSVVLTVVCWFVWFVVDVAHATLDAAVLQQHRISRIVMADQALLTVREGAALQAWDAEARVWQPVAEPRGNGIPVIDGPYYHTPSKLMIIGQGFRNPLGGRSQRLALRVAGAGDGWKPREGPALPPGAAALVLARDETLYAVAPDNVYRFHGNLAAKGSPLRILGFQVPLPGGAEFRPALPAGRPALVAPISAAADPQLPRIAVCSGNDVLVFRQESDGSLQEEAHRSLDTTDYEGSAVAIAGESVLVAREEGNILLLSAMDLATRRELKLERESQPRFVAAAPDGSRFAVLFQNRYLWLIDAATGDARRAPLPAQGEISSLAWTTDRLWIADYANRVVAYDPTTLKRIEVYQPELSSWEIAYYYVFDPLYTVFPKPRLLNNTVQYLLTGKRTTDMGFMQGNLSQQRDDLRPWQPVQSGLLFVGVMLLGACVYIERHEF